MFGTGAWPPRLAMLHRDGFGIMLIVAEASDGVRPTGPGASGTCPFGLATWAWG